MPYLMTLGLANNKLGKSLLKQLGESKILEQIVVLDLNDNIFSELIPVLVTFKMPNMRSLYLNLNEQGLEKLKDEDLQMLLSADFFKNLKNLLMGKFP